MSRNAHFALPEANYDPVGPSPQNDAMARQEFGRRLYSLMTERNWSQSDLARRAFGEESAKVKDPKTGKMRVVKQALGRDKISTYIRGRSRPDPKTLQQLAQAFGMTPQDLMPDSVRRAIDNEMPAFEMRQAAGHPDKVWLRVNQMVSAQVAAAVSQLLFGGQR